MSAKLGIRLGPYEILSSLGAGGMGMVLRAAARKRRRSLTMILTGIVGLAIGMSVTLDKSAAEKNSPASHHHTRHLDQAAGRDDPRVTSLGLQHVHAGDGPL